MLSSIQLIGLMMAGYCFHPTTNLGGLRAAAQSISYDGAFWCWRWSWDVHSLSSIDIVEQQSGYASGLEYLATAHRFHHLLIATLAECERLPFDLPSRRRTSGRLPDRVLKIRPSTGFLVSIWCFLCW